MGRKTYTLTALAKLARVSSPCAFRYKNRLVNHRVPGTAGRGALYYFSAVEDLKAYRDQGLARRGRRP